MTFSRKSYRRILSDLLCAGLIPSTNWREDITTDTLLLRHDIDFSITHAHKLAELESELGIKSTFFFMMTSNMYNPFSKFNTVLINEIAEMGHKISLHFDPTVYSDLQEFEHEKAMFENSFNVLIDIVSIHRPGPFLEKNNILLSGVPHTYNDVYFKHMTYISDSGRRDPSLQLTKHANKVDRKGLHLLIHPIWWICDGNNATETLDNWLAENQGFIKREIKANCKTYNG